MTGRSTSARARAVAIAFALPCVVGVGVGACGAKQTDGPSYPPRPPGCNVTLFREGPTMPTVNIGPVSAQCDDSVSDDDCLRTLFDQVCKLGGDVVWGVLDKSRIDGGKLHWTGRAAHTK